MLSKKSFRILLSLLLITTLSFLIQLKAEDSNKEEKEFGQEKWE